MELSQRTWLAVTVVLNTSKIEDGITSGSSQKRVK